MFRILCVSIIVFHTGWRRNEQVRRPRALFRARVPPCPVFFFALFFGFHRLYFCRRTCGGRRVGRRSRERSLTSATLSHLFSFLCNDHHRSHARVRECQTRSGVELKGEKTPWQDNDTSFFVLLTYLLCYTSALTKPALRGNALYNIYRVYSDGGRRDEENEGELREKRK